MMLVTRLLLLSAALISASCGSALAGLGEVATEGGVASTVSPLTSVTGAITSTYAGELIQNEIITVQGTGHEPCIKVTADNVTIKNVQCITDGNRDGIDNFNTNGLHVSYFEADAPAINGTGGRGTDNATQVYYAITGNSYLWADHITFRNYGTGITELDAPGMFLDYIEGYNMQGPYPGGQLAQFVRTPGTLRHFYVYNDPLKSHPEDCINVFGAPNNALGVGAANVTIFSGVIDGDNSPSGQGIVSDSGSSYVMVDTVDAVHMGNGAFAAYGNDAVYTNVRSFSNIGVGQGGRAAPSSGALQFGLAGTNGTITGTYTNPVNGNIQSGSGSSGNTIAVIQDTTAQVMPHITNHFPWTTQTIDPSAIGGLASSATFDTTRGENITGSIGFPVEAGFQAYGTNLATATQLEKDYTSVSSVAPGTGVRLRGTLGVPQDVWNDGANPLLVYPSTTAMAIGATGTAGAAATIAAGGHATFILFPGNRYRQKS